MRFTKEKLIKILEGKCVKYRKLQDYFSYLGFPDHYNPEKAEFYKKARWEIEDILDMLGDPIQFEACYDLYAPYEVIER